MSMRTDKLNPSRCRCTRVFDSEGRFAPEYDDADTQTIDCKQVVLAIGQSIEWGSLLEGSAVELGRGNTAVADGFTYQTAQDDVFVGGDAFTGPRFVIDAIAAGREAATSLHRFVQKGSSLTTGRNQLHYVELDKSNIALNPGKYDHAGRQVPGLPLRVERRASLQVSAPHSLKSRSGRKLLGAFLVARAWSIRTNASVAAQTTRCNLTLISLSREHPECSTMVPSEDKIKEILPNAAKMLAGRIVPGKKIF